MNADIRVLYADAEPALAEAAATAIEREDAGIAVDTVGSAREGLEYLAENEADCVVSDYELPERDGIEFLEAVREAHPGIPFVLYTDAGSEAVASDAISAGVTDYLRKENGAEQYAALARRIRSAAESARAEHEARRVRTQMEAIVENTTDAIVIIDRESTVQFANPAAEDVFGYEPAELDGASLTALMPPRYRERHRKAVERYLETDERTMNWQSVEFRGQHRDGHEVPISIAFGEFEQAGETRFIGVIRDITERRERERELERQNTRLNRFASVVSHDLRNPLNVADGHLELARENYDDDHLESVARALDRMDRIVEDMLWLAREGQDIGGTVAVDLRAASEAAWEIAADGVGELDVVASERAVIEADEDRLRQLLENLFRNAVEHGSTDSRAGPGDSVEHGTELVEPDGDAGEGVTVTVGDLPDGFYVEDDGPGIPESEREEVFEAGYTTSETGIGFGLSIAKQVAEAHGWEIRVTEGTTGGARFEITGADVER